MLDAGDIAAGTVTINTGAAFYTAVVLVVYVGTVYADFLHLEHHPDAYVSTSMVNKVWTTPKYLTAGHELPLVQTTRANVAQTSTIGTLIQNTQGTISMSAYRYPVPADGSVSGSINMVGAGFEYYFWRLAVRN